MNITHEIIKTESGKYALFVGGEYIGEYARKFTAERGLERVLKRLETESADAQTDSREAAAGCAAAQLHPTSNTGGKVTRGARSVQPINISVTRGARSVQPINISVKKHHIGLWITAN